MKKLISIILISVMLISVLAINTGAESEFTKDEATQLAFEAYKTVQILWQGSYYDTVSGESIESTTVLIPSYRASTPEDEPDDYDNEKYFEIFKATEAGVPYDTKWESKNGARYDLLSPVNGFNHAFDTLDDVRNFCKKVFTDEEAERNLYTVLSESPSKMKIERFRISKEGKLLAFSVGFDAQYNPVYRVEKIHDLKVNENKAEIHVFLRKIKSAGLFLYETTVEFEKTADGWRVSGGTMTQVFRGEINPVEITNTSDEAPLYIAAIALVSLAAPVVMKRRKREF